LGRNARYARRIPGISLIQDLDRIVLTADEECVPGFAGHSCED
jgi:hypothetical protein